MYPVHRELNHLLLKHLKSYHEFYGSNERGGNDTVKYYGFFWSDFLWGEPLKKRSCCLLLCWEDDGDHDGDQRHLLSAVLKKLTRGYVDIWEVSWNYSDTGVCVGRVLGVCPRCVCLSVCICGPAWHRVRGAVCRWRARGRGHFPVGSRWRPRFWKLQQ